MVLGQSQGLGLALARMVTLSVDPRLRAVCFLVIIIWFAFSALTLLVGRQEEHTACKNWSDEVLVWLSVWSEVQIACIWSS